MKTYEYVIIGAGIVGLTIARELKLRFPACSVCILEKEADVAMHASGRNSGVLHAGFYYTADSLKARFTVEGNRAMTRYCEENGLAIRKNGKLVIAQNESELAGLEELKRRADRNGVELRWVDEQEAWEIDPCAVTYQKALYSPNTSSVDPIEVCQTIKKEIRERGVDLYFQHPFRRADQHAVVAGEQRFGYRYLINAAGLYADKIAHEFGFGRNYTIIPFKGIYMKYKKNKTDVRTNLYPVPNLKNPFLGVHFTKTVDGSIKIGPTAIPAFWRGNYKGLQNFKLREMIGILYYEAKLFFTNSFHFRSLAFHEMRKYSKSFFVRDALGMVRDVDANGFGERLRPGIRAQLLNKKTLELIQDFLLEGDERSMHVLNAVSPAFTCSMPFASYIVDQILEKRGTPREQPN